MTLYLIDYLLQDEILSILRIDLIGRIWIIVALLKSAAA